MSANSTSYRYQRAHLKGARVNNGRHMQKQGGGMNIVPAKKLTTLGIRNRYQWYADYQQKLSQMLYAEAEPRGRFRR